MWLFPPEEYRRLRIGCPSIIPLEVEIYGLSNTEDYSLANVQRHIVANKAKAGVIPYREGHFYIRRIALHPQDPVETVAMNYT